MASVAPRILYVITDLNLGGVPLHLHRLVGAMRLRGFLPSVVSLAGPGPVTEMFRREGVDVFSCDGRGGWDFRVIGKLAHILGNAKPDVLHALLFHANVAARLAARKASFPPDRVVCEIQTVEVERRWHLRVGRWTHRCCRVTIGNSPSVIEHLADRAGIPRDRLRLVRGGIDPTPLRDAAPADLSTLGFPIDGPIVLWAGRLDPIKGLEVLVQAFRLIAKRRSGRTGGAHGAHLLLAGDGPLRERLARKINRWGLTRSVHLLGTRRDLPRLLKAADVFAFPSRTEGLPNALLEAMAARCPVVATDVPGCRDLIEHERTGLLVPYGDAEALCSALLRLLADREAAKRLACRASEMVTSRWHIDKTFDAYAALYEEITSVRHDRPGAPSLTEPRPL